MTDNLPPLPEPLCNLPDYCRQAISAYALAAQALEREACAKVCEELRLVNSFAPAQVQGFTVAKMACVDAIRARGGKDGGNG